MIEETYPDKLTCQVFLHGYQRFRCILAEQKSLKTTHVGIGGANSKGSRAKWSQVPGSNALSVVLIRCQLTRWDRKPANDCQCENINLVRVLRIEGCWHEIVVLLSLGLLVLWTIGPCAVLSFIRFPPLRRLLGLDDRIK